MENKFHRAMAKIYEEAKKEGYTASYFLRMLSEHGGVETAQRLVNSDTPSEGFTRLWMMKRLDLSVESLVLKPEWETLFSDDERERARDRLAKYMGEVTKELILAFTCLIPEMNINLRWGHMERIVCLHDGC